MGAKKWESPTDSYNLTLQERDFVRLYTEGDEGVRSNGTACYKLAYNVKGHKDNSIWVYASKEMNKPHVKEAIKGYLERYNAEWVKNRLAEEASKASNKAADKIRATELIGKVHGMFVDKTEQTIKLDSILASDDAAE